MFNEQIQTTELGVEGTFHSNAYQEKHRQQETLSRGLSLSFLSSEIFLPPIPSLPILLILSHGVVLLRPAIASLAIASLRTAIARVEEWPHGIAQEGNTVNSYEKMIRMRVDRRKILPVICRSPKAPRSPGILSAVQIRTVQSNLPRTL